ncbi:MAG TPA: endonuclease III domain-containing protein [Terriglobia bacterium]|nr:endonuclease III domain-containing protein [Terriglobia bacterium]
MAHGARYPGGKLQPPLIRYYQRLFESLGPQGWWPARTRMEVILGAILTQNTSWNNALRAIACLKKSGLLRLESLRRTSAAELESCVRPAGFYRQKSAAIRNFVAWLDRNYHGSLRALFAAPVERVRIELLGLKGVGPETADAILLYAGRKPLFVADAYTRRVLARHAWLPPSASYETAQNLLHRELPRDEQLFNEFHALVVEIGKRYCQRQIPNCRPCPLREFLPEPGLPSSSSRAGRVLAIQPV